MLTLDLKAPEVTKTSMVSDLLKTLHILSHLSIKHVRDKLRPGTVSDASLSVQEILGDAVVQRLGKDVRDLVELGLGKLTSSLVEVDLSDLENLDSESSTDTSDDSEGECNLLLSVDIGVLHSQNVSEIVGFLQYEGTL